MNTHATSGVHPIALFFCSPDVSFVGYTIPHPSEPKMNLRLQTRGTPAVDVLRWGLKTLMEMCDHIDEQADEVLPA